MVVGEGDGDVNRLFGEGDIVGGLESLVNLLGFIVLQPLLEEGGEGGHVEHLLGGMVSHRHLSVAIEKFLCQTALASRPFLLPLQFLQIDVLLLGIARKDVVEAQGSILKELVKILCAYIQDTEKSQHKG